MHPGDEDNPGYASPPCFMHELDPAFSAEQTDAQAAVDVARWRKAQRTRLLAERLALPADLRAQAAQRIASRLDAEIGTVEGSVVGMYWPFRGEPDLREWASGVTARGGQLALPVVLEKGKPLEFRTCLPTRSWRRAAGTSRCRLAARRPFRTSSWRRWWAMTRPGSGSAMAAGSTTGPWLRCRAGR